MKILTLNWTYGENSTGKIIKDIEKSLKGEEIEFFHIYEFGYKQKAKNAYRLNGCIIYKIYYRISRITGYQYEIGNIPALKCICKIKREMPDLVHIHCPNAGSINLFMLFEYLKKKKIPTVITNHAEFFYTGTCAHAQECKKYMTGCGKCHDVKNKCNTVFFDRTAHTWEKMFSAFKNFQHICMIAVSPWVEERMKNSVIAGHMHTITIYNGIDTKNIFYPRKLTKKNRTTILHVTANFAVDDDNKGGKYILELADRLKEEPIEIWVVGPYQIGKERTPSNIKFMGIIKEQNELASIYSEADLTVITSRRETFGMVYAESVCCGTPVVGFRNGGTDSIAINGTGEFVPFGDVNALEAKVKVWLQKPKMDTELIKNIHAKFSQERMGREYYDIYKEMIGK